VPPLKPRMPQVSFAGGDGLVVQVVWADMLVMSNRRLTVRSLKRNMVRGFEYWLKEKMMKN
jgi:hypothetical protein